MIRSRHAWAAAVVAGTLSAQTVIPIDPRATFLHTQQDPCLNAPAIALASIPGALPGAWLELERRGAWDNGPGGDDRTSLAAVFSQGDMLLPVSTSGAPRLPGAMGTGPSCSSSPTYFGGAATDIAEDFWVCRQGYADRVRVRVPNGATHLFASVADSLFYDNADPNGDLELVITPVAAPLHRGTAEDLELRSGVGGVPTATPDRKTARAGETLTIEVASTFGTSEGSLFVLALDTFPTGSAPPWGPLPSLWIGPGASTELLSVLGPTAATWSRQVPPGLAGVTAIVQAAALAPLARNGLYIATHAHEIQLVL